MKTWIGSDRCVFVPIKTSIFLLWCTEMCWKNLLLSNPSFIPHCFLLLTIVALLVQILFAVLAAAACCRPSGRGAFAGVQLPWAVTRYWAILLTWQPSVVAMATERKGREERQEGGSEACDCVHKMGIVSQLVLAADYQL